MLVAQVRRMHWQAVARYAAGIAALSWRTGPEDAQHQNDLARNLVEPLIYGHSIMVRLKSDRKSVVFTRESLLAVFRIALTEMSEGEAGDEQSPDAFTRAILLANDILSDEITPSEMTQSALDLRSSELRSIVLQQPNLHLSIERSAAFMRWTETDAAMKSPNYLPVRDDFERFTNLTPDEYLAAGYVLLARTASMKTWDDVHNLGVAFKVTDWLHDVKEPRVLQMFFDANSVPIEQARESWCAEDSLSFAASRPLWTHPIVDAGDGLYCLPSPLHLMNKFGEGFYFVLFDGYRNDGLDEKGRDKNMRFSQFWSEFLETYVYERFCEGYAGKPDVVVRPESEYKPGVKSTDVVITEDGDFIFVEVVAKRLNMRASVAKLDEQKLAGDFRMGIVEKVKELDRNIKDFRAGALFPDLSRKDNYRIFPVIVSPNEWPRAYLLSTLLPEVLPEQKWLEGTEPLEILDVAEVERLEAVVANNSLGALLDRKNRTRPHDRLQSMHNYLTTVECGLETSENPAYKRADDTASRLIAFAQGWGN